MINKDYDHYFLLLNYKFKNFQKLYIYQFLRPSFSAPFIKTPGIVPYISYEILNEFSY